MARRIISIEKEATFQGKTERWSNAYCYETAATTDAEYSTLIDAIVAAERPVHAPQVSFKRASVYTTQGLNGPADLGSMYFVKDLSVVGTAIASGGGTMYREAAVLVKWPLPRKQKATGLGRQRSLKKWIHTCSVMGFNTAVNQGTEALTSTEKGPFMTYAASIGGPVTGTTLVAPDGTPPSGVAQVHDYLEHRQFKRGRKKKVTA